MGQHYFKNKLFSINNYINFLENFPRYDYVELYDVDASGKESFRGRFCGDNKV